MLRGLAGTRVFVTGATGFIGARLVARLLELGARPHLLVRNPSDPKARVWRKGSVALHSGDIVDARAVMDAVSKADPVLAYSLARPRGDGDAQGADVKAVLILAAALKTAAPRLRLWVRTGLRLSDGFDLRAEEELDDSVRRRYALPVTTLRLFGVYGPGQSGNEELQRLVRGLAPTAGSLRDSQDLFAGVKDFVYVDDVVEAYLKASLSPGAVGRSFDIGTGRGLTSQQLRAVSQGGRAIGSKRTDVRNGEAADIAPAKRYLGWEPRVSLQEGLRRLSNEEGH